MIFNLFLIFILPALLAFKNKSPQQFLYGLVRELEKGLRRGGLCVPSLRLWVMERDPKRVHRSPFARLEGAGGRPAGHNPVLLNLPTSDGSGEAAHPDVLHVPEGWGAGRWTWLMAATPYPLGTDYFENPEFYVSRDGIHWTVPEGLSNPLARAPLKPERHAGSEFYSDPSLLMTDDGTLFFYYRWTAVFKSETENKVFLTASRDGVHWTAPEIILQERARTGRDRKFLSPSVLRLNNKNYALWTVEYEDGRRFIMRRTGPDGRHWGAPVRTRIEEPAAGAFNPPWHLDVVRAAGESGERGGLRLALTTAIERGYEAELFIGRSVDEGLSWTLDGKPFEPEYHFEGKRIYRSSLVPMPGGSYRLYYSALSLNGTWNMAMTEP